MCGIHFTITSDTFANGTEKYMNDAFVAGSVRGMHSSGIFQVDQKGDIEMYKKAVNGANFIGEEGAKRLLAKTGRSPLTVGHVRHATQGEVNDENAHPFIVTRDDGTHVVGVHNGTLRGWKNKAGGKDQVVDSAWAFQKLADEGDDAFQYFDGAFAFVWYDSQDPGYVYMARNKERPLHFLTTADRKTMIGASELGMLGWLTGRHDIKPHVDKTIAFRYLEPDTIYRFSLKNVADFKSWPMQKYDPRTTIYTPPTPVNNNYNNMHPALRRGYDAWGRNTNYNNTQDMIPWDDDGEPDPYGYLSRSRNYREEYEQRKQDELLQDVGNAIDAIIAKAREPESYAPEVNDAEMEALKAADPATFRGISDKLARWKVVKADEKKAAEVKKDAPKSEEDRAVRMLDSNGIFLSDPNDSSATKGERALAQGHAVWGQVGKFYGILWDEEEKTVQGQLLIYRNGKEIEVEGELRFCTGKGAAARYVDKVEPVLVAIVGVISATQVFPECYVVADLTNSNKAQLDQHVSRLARAN